MLRFLIFLALSSAVASETNIQAYRVDLDGKIYNVYEATNWDYFRDATVLQILPDGIFAQSRTLGQIHLRNIPTERLYDGRLISFCALPYGFYEFTNSTGFHRILEYDYGHLPDRAKFEAFLRTNIPPVTNSKATIRKSP